MPYARRRPSAPDEALVRQRLEQLLGPGPARRDEPASDIWEGDGQGDGETTVFADRAGYVSADRAGYVSADRAGLVSGSSEVSGVSEVSGGLEVTGGLWRPRRAALEARTPPEDLLGAQLSDAPDTGRHRSGGGPPLLTVPGSLRRAQVRVSPATVLGMLLVVLLAAVVFGWRVWASGQASAPEPVVPIAAPDDGQVTADPTEEEPGDPESDAAAATPTVLVVHVAGAVTEPGVVELAPGSRVREAVEAAGGLAAEADTGRINLARSLADGERLWVPVPGEEEPEVPGGGQSSGGQPAAPGGAEPVEGGETSAGTAVDLNTADQAALESLPGVGPVTAGRILAWRDEHGRFSSAEELLEVSGIGERTLEQLRPHITW